MAGEKNFNIKNGLSVGGVEVINSSGDLVAAGVGTAVNEAIADKIGGIISATGGATATYNDGADTIVIDVPITDEDNMASNSATAIPSQQSVKAYVDSQILTKDNTDEITEGSSNLYFTNARADARISNAIKDEDNMASDSATHVPSQQSVKAYVDAVTTSLNSQDLDISSDSGTIDVDLDTETFTIAGGAGIDTSATGTTLTIAGELATETNAGIATFDGTDFTVSSGDVTVNAERIQDIVGAMVSSNTESGITVAYEDGDGTLDFTVGTLNQDTTGNAATATALETARTIGGVSFDGSASINLPGVNTTGNQNTTGSSASCTGNAATATALATARTIHGVSFDGSANIDLTEVVQDTVGAMFSSNTETNVTATYQDDDGTIDLVVGDTTGNAATATALETGRTIGMTGDVVWTSAAFDGSGNVTGTATIQANSVALGTDTTGNYMSDVSAGTGVTVSHTAGEGSTATISIGQAVSTSSDVTFGDIAATDLTLSGNLTVNGTTTTASSTNTVIADTLIELGNGTSGTPANDSGFVIERGSSDNAFIGFDESADKFTMGTGSFTGASTGNLTITTGTLVANLEGNVTGAVTGNASTATTLQNARTINGVSFDGSANITTLTAGTGVSVSGTAVSIGQAVATTSDVEFNEITTNYASNSGGVARNIYQSTSAPGGGDGAVGDLWILYS
tara:strand:- start:52 stop:2112 length:2061 start_codon:yes stop_codon:yes gene_type:complete